jgi:hypothetical protein
MDLLYVSAEQERVTRFEIPSSEERSTFGDESTKNISSSTNRKELTLNKVLLELIPLVFVGLLWLVLWRILLRNLAALQGKLTVGIRDKVLPDVDRSNTTFITLSSAALVLTFSLLQIWSTKPLEKRYYLVISWVGFAVTVFMGALLSIGLYIYRTHYHCVVKDVETSLSGRDKMDPRDGARVRLSLNRSKSMERVLFSIITLQPMLFLLSVVYLLMFAIRNLQ